MIRSRSDFASLSRVISVAALAFVFPGAPEAGAAQAAPPQSAPQPQGSPSPEASPADKGVTRAEDLTVTARRREENVQDVPLAITVKTGVDLQIAATADIGELQGEVPNLAIYQGRNQSTTLTPR